jgi:hypothetical protein
MLGPGSRSQVTKKRDFVLAFGVAQRRGPQHAEEKAHSPGLAFVKLDFLIRTKWGSNADRF